MTKAHDKRVKASLEASRLANRAERLEIERRRREAESERASALLVLRELCGLYGDNSWTDDTPFATILADYLARPLADEMQQARRYLAGLQARIRRQEEQLAAPSASVAPVPIERPTLVDPDHEARVEAIRDRSGSQYRARCRCGWASALARTEREAEAAADAHQARYRARNRQSHG